MNPNKLSKEDQRYYYHGLILHLADELSLYEEYSDYLKLHHSLDNLKHEAEILKRQTEEHNE